MINVFFVPGMFGTTIEYILRSYTNEYNKIKCTIEKDGSMHSIRKEFHPKCLDDLQHIPETINSTSITTPIYPFRDLKFPSLLKRYEKFISQGKCILIHSTDLRSSELNTIFEYYKICQGSDVKLGLGIFFNGFDNNVKQWNQEYNSWCDMQPWELREWFSLAYPQWVQEWSDSQHYVNDTWLKISNTEIINNTEYTFKKIINFCGLTVSEGLNEFVTDWKTAQQYIVDEFILLDNIISSTLELQDFYWQPVSIVSESIIQQRLRSIGYELQCDGLNIFPTSSKDLYKLLIKI